MSVCVFLSLNIDSCGKSVERNFDDYCLYHHLCSKVICTYLSVLVMHCSVGVGTRFYGLHSEFIVCTNVTFSVPEHCCFIWGDSEVER